MVAMWTSHRGEASGESPTPEQIERWRRRMSVPENEFPVGVGVTALLGRTGDAAVGITMVEAYPHGFRFNLAVRLRRARPGVRGGLFTLIGGHARHGGEVPLEDRLLLGIEYADGRRASTLTDQRMSDPGTMTDGDALVLVHQGGGGGDRTVDQAYWVTPLPPEGPVTFVLSWPAFGLPESRTVIDSAPIRAAAAESVALWPPQPDEEPEEPPPPPRPPTGWFSEP